MPVTPVSDTGCKEVVSRLAVVDLLDPRLWMARHIATLTWQVRVGGRVRVRVKVKVIE